MKKMRVLLSLVLVGAACGFVAVAPGGRHHRGALLMATEAKVDYASMTAEALEEELRSTQNAMFAMNLEKWQSKRKGFSGHEMRKLKKKVAQIMPHFESKTEQLDVGEKAATEAVNQE